MMDHEITIVPKKMPRPTTRTTIRWALEASIPVLPILALGAVESFNFTNFDIYFAAYSVIYGSIVQISVAILALVWIGYTAFRHRWLEAAGYSAFLVVIYVAFWQLYEAGTLLGDGIHLCIDYPSYRAQIAKLPDNAPKFITFDWGATGIAGSGDTQSTLVYAELQKGEAFPAPADLPEGMTEKVTHLFGHFYLVVDSW